MIINRIVRWVPGLADGQEVHTLAGVEEGTILLNILKDLMVLLLKVSIGYQ